MKTRFRALAAVGALAAGCAVVPASAAAEWHPCQENPGAECATMRVPVDWANPAGPSIGIAVARRHATDPAARVGSLVYAPAGPGSSGVDAVTNDQLFGLMFPPEQAAKFDVVSFDPRGVRRSGPVRCDGKLAGALGDTAPRDQAEFTRLLGAQAALGASCRERTGPVIDHLDSRTQARDLDALRVFLGEEKLNVYALSYGTVVGEMYAELFGDRIRAMVLDAVVDHSADTVRTEITGAAAAEDSFSYFADWCDRSTACSLHGKPVRALVAALYAKADQGKLTDPDDPGRPLDRGGLAHRILEPLGNAGVTEAANRIARLVAGPSAVRSDPPSPDALPIYLYCADHRSSIGSYAALREVTARKAAVAPLVKTGWHGVPQLCANPPFATANPPHRLDADDAPPVLVTNSRYDDSTPHAGAARIAAQLPGSAFVTYDGMGHGAAVRGRCMRDVVTAYLTLGSTPPPGLHCPAEPLP
ncbi:alpha/beta hydrolase [Amycolatopsis sp. CA-230715]|uniref:alpha/beta hydrolase n=1 Tax=Amycolatopsis sp. CA-230715 TaxID=2745196 RepID=UPI001C017837|nr:alpha/beta hydrolase [Amycolatopsis sp. CA-230715]QWF84759.1 Carboxylesterase A [Amycolatopsis sp. CA-230715]